jgi:hypothetical protein
MVWFVLLRFEKVGDSTWLAKENYFCQDHPSGLRAAKAHWALSFESHLAWYEKSACLPLANKRFFRG